MRPFLVLLLAAVTVLAAPAGATDFLSTDRYALAAGETLTNELWLRSQTIVIAGTAQDDLFLLAGGGAAPPAANDRPSMLLSGNMGGDVWAAGDSIDLSGTASRHARLLGFKSARIEGHVARNLIAMGSTVLVDKQATVDGTAILAGQDVLVDGAILGKTRIYGTRVTLSGTFGDGLTIVASDINVMPGTRITGNLRYLMDKDLILDRRVVMDGKLVRMEPSAPKEASGISLSAVLLQLGFCAAAMLAGLAFINFFPSVAAMSVQKLTESFWRSLLIGFVAFCLVPMTAFFLIFTLIGLPLAVLLVLGYFILVYLAKVVSGIYLGHLILRRYRARSPASVLSPLMLGLLAMYAVALLPFPIDILIWFSFTLMGLGALAGAILDRRTPIMVAYSPPPPAPEETK